MELSTQQLGVVNKVLDWYKGFDTNPTADPVITIGGYAGTGKTTIVKYIAEKLPEKNIIFCAYTGKAAQVLSSKLGREVSTIHKLLYKPVVAQEITKERFFRINTGGDVLYERYKVGEKKGQYKLDEYGSKIPLYTEKEVKFQAVRGWERVKDLDADLIIIDEASMVTKKILDDLLSFNIPIIAIGDHGQLPPVASNYNLMQRPMYILEEIFRQAKDNSIIELSALVREGTPLKIGSYGKETRRLPKEYSDKAIEGIAPFILQGRGIILAAYNHKRKRINTQVRKFLKLENKDLHIGEIVICLYNKMEMGLANGMMFKVIEILGTNANFHHVTIEDIFTPERRLTVRIARQQLGNKELLSHLRSKYELFDYGYCLTVHKSQGSEIENVLLFEPHPFGLRQIGIDFKRWMYTGITRAKNNLVIIKDYDA